MTYINQSLGRNESLHYKAHLPTVRHVAGWGVLILSVITSLAAAVGNFEWIAVVPAVVGMGLFVVIMLPVWTTEIGVTTQRLVYKRGLLQRATKELQLRAIEEVNLKQGLLGRLLNYGNVELHGTGVDDIRLLTLGDPIAVQRAMQEVIGAVSQPSPMPPPNVG